MRGEKIKLGKRMKKIKYKEKSEMAFLFCKKRRRIKMEHIIAIGILETIILNFKQREEKITAEKIERKFEWLLNKNKEIISAYAIVALDNIDKRPNAITPREIEAEIQAIKGLYTTDKLIERANYLKRRKNKCLY